MNISKIATLVIVSAVALFVGAPMKADASAASDKKKLKTLIAQLKALPNEESPFSKVKALVTKIVKLDPKKAASIYKLGLKKLAKNPQQKTQANQISKQVVSIVKKSDLSDSQIAKITGQVQKEATKVPDYQASIIPFVGLAIA